MEVKKVLLAVAVVLAIFSLVNIQWGIVPHRWLRIITSIIFFVFAVRIVGFQKMGGLLIFFSLIVCDFLLLKYEILTSKYIYYSLHSLIVLSLILLTIRGMKWRKISGFEIGSVTLFLIFSCFIFLALREFFNIEDVPLKILFNINGSFMVILVVLAFFQSINQTNLLGSYFLLGILGFIFSELILFTIYFLNAPYFRYIDNFFYVAGLFFLLKVSLENKLIQESFLNLKEEKEKEDVQDYKNRGVYR